MRWRQFLGVLKRRKRAKTPLRDSEEALRRNEAWLTEAQRLSHTGTWVLNPTTMQYLYWSDESYRIWGFDPLQGLPSRDALWQRIHDRDRVWEKVQQALRQKKDYSGEFKIVLPNGTVKYLAATSHHLFSPNGEIIEVIGTNVDVTERKRAEQALRDSEAKFRDFAETASDWFCEMGPDYKFTLLSENAFGSGAADRIGTACWDHALDLETEPEKWRLLQETVFSRKPFRDFVYRALSGNGSPMYVRASGKPLFDANGEFRGYRGTCSDVTEITRAQEALRESERSSRSAIDGIAGLLAIMAPNGELETVNRPCLEYFGRSPEWLANWGTNDAVHPEDLPRVVELFKSAMAAEIPYHFDQRLRRFDGEYRWFDNRGVPIRDDSGRITRWYVLLTDIEDRKRAEHALRSALDGIAGLIVVLAPNGEVETVNRPVFEYFGRSLEWLKNWGTNDALHPEDLPRTLEVFKGAMASGNPFQNELRLRRSDGEYRWFDTRHVPIRDDSGCIVRWYVLATDIEDRKRAEHASRSAIDGIAGLVAILAPNGEVETVNRPLFEYFGRSLEELKNWGTSDAVHPEDLPRVLELNTRGLASGLPFNFELRLRRFDGEYRLFDTRVVPTRDVSGRIERWYNLLMDIEDRSRALARLEQMRSDFAHMNRVSMMGELAASLSHEITQPIASARNNARAAQNYLDMQPPNLGEVSEALSCVVGDTDRAGDIIDRIREHIKKAPPRKERFDLNAAINEVIVLARSVIAMHGVSVQTQLADGLFPVQGDRVQLQQVVLNLILNAVEAMGSVEAGTRELLIGTEQNNTGALVAVRDSGPGIDSMHLERVFDAFYTTKSRGVGMGLSICRSIIDAHGGQLWADVNASGGAVFQFTFPSAEKELTNPRPADHRTEEPNRGTVRDTSR
jgi:PAS domain S-box-containing protein